MIKKLTPAIFIGLLAACAGNSDNKTVTVVAPKPEVLASPAADSCAEPFLFTDKNGQVTLSWVEKKGTQSTLKFATLQHDQWDTPVNIATGNNWFVNWADYPIVVADGNNNLVAHYLEKSAPNTFTYDIKLVTSSDKGQSWGKAQLLHNDGKKAEHGFVSMVPYGDKYFVSWLDGRNAAQEGKEGGHGGHHGEMTIRAAILDKTGKKESEWELDSRVCDCCQTSAAITANGPVVVYRDRSSDEIRDMSIVRFVNGAWTSPIPIHADNWKIEGCPVNGPRMDAKGNNLAIAWFSMPGQQAQVNVTFSSDGGATFDKPIRIDEGKAIGRVDLLMKDDTTAFVSWMEGAAIKAAKVYANGTRDSSIVVAASSESRSGGFPQMTRSGNKIIFAWTDNKEKTIKLASLTP
jgi:hypothetical protein